MENTISIPTLQGKVAVVTGASREIGAAMAKALAARGAAVLVSHYAEPDLAAAIVNDIQAVGGTAIVHEANLADMSQARSPIEVAIREFGRIDIYAANAGITHWSSFLDYTEKDWDTVVDLNLKGSFFSAQAAARQMVAQGSPGQIIFSSSVMGTRAMANASPYSVTKAGLLHMARVLAKELGAYSISVNALIIGATINERNLKGDPDYNEHWKPFIPAGRATLPEDVARGLLYLVDNPFITGSGLMLDGGWSTQSPVPGEAS
jgi:NAD(P)-dependent dehydrogenase (short-subunit alcohol dehydrogenase family)